VAKLNVEQAILRARAHARKGEADQARSLLEMVLEAYPGNQRARSELAKLDPPRRAATNPQHPPQDKVDALLGLYNQRRFAQTAQRAESLTDEYPNSFVLWNIYGAAHVAIGELGKAEKGFESAVRIAPNFADAHSNMGNILKRRGKLDDAVAAYKRALAIKPDHAEAHFNMGVALKRLGDLEDAIACYQRALTANPDHAEAHYSMGNALMDRGRVDDAITSYQSALTRKPDHADAHYGIGNALMARGQADDAVACYQRALVVRPDHAEAHFNMGLAFKRLEKLEDAIACYQRVLSIKPDHADAHCNMSNALMEQGRFDDAIASCQRALAVRPDHAEAHFNMGVAFKRQEKLEDAMACYQRALSIKPDHAGAHYGTGNALKAQGKLDEAIASYRRAIAIEPDHAEAHNNMGSALMVQGKPDEAISAYQHALAIRPDNAGALNNMGSALMEQGKPDEAISAYQRALTINPDDVASHNNMGSTLKLLGRLDEAIASYGRALANDPDCASAEAQLLRLRESICDFTVSGRLPEASARLGISTESVSNFDALSWADNPEQQFLRAKKWADQNFSQTPLPLPALPKKNPERLRIGYFSADMHIHPCMYLIAGLLESHNRSDVEVFAYSYGPHSDDEMRRRVSSAVDRFIDVRGMPDKEIVRMVRNDKIDISIDLNGYTRNGRTELFQYRLSPVQVNFLGFPGSLAADFIDYIIADHVVIPEETRHLYSENIIYMPHTYMPGDDTREISGTSTSRSDFALPDDAFVFCCFNNNYKIGSREFDIWMRLLSEIDDSVLWLLKSNKWSEQNLHKEAERRGVDPSRLIFAEKVPQAEHLARHKHADLFIDTFNYNAHTTASDALWSGLPIVTKKGEQFAARVAASLLTAVGLPELITESVEDYENLILDLAAHPVKLAEIRARLSHQRVREPLFDTKRFTRNFEHGLRCAYDLHFDGKQPRDIQVTEPDR